MAANSAGTLLALLLMPALIGLAGVIPVVIGCGAIYAGVGLGGLVLHAGWVEAGQRQPA